MDCLDEETILAFCQGALTADARERVQEHMDSCDECRALVSAFAQSSFVGGAHQITAESSRDEASEATFSAPDPGGTPRGVGVDSNSPVRPGQILAGRFEVERVLGQGGMGVVVAARHTQLEQRVALKFLLPLACEVPGAVARFLREGKAAARITSEHVARVMDTGVLDAPLGRGAPYLVMEYLEGTDLGQLIHRSGPVDASVAMEYVLQACEAIVEAHGLGIVHRDLKPANLFLSRRADGSPLVKVLDFGISKVEGGGSRSQLTSASVLMGSPRYMSPEQMMNAKEVDARTDVWALGVILFELVTGKPVWHADTMQGLCALIAGAPAPSLRDVAPEVPAELAEVVARCLVKAREERIASVADLALALSPIAPASARTSIERILRVARREALPVSPRSADPSTSVNAPLLDASATTFGRRRNGWSSPGVVLGSAVLLLLVAGVVVNAVGLRPTSRTVSDPRAAVSAAQVDSTPRLQASVAIEPSAPPVAASLPTLTARREASVLAPSATASTANGSRTPRVSPSIAHAASSLGGPAVAASGLPVPAVKPEVPAGPENRALTDRK